MGFTNWLGSLMDFINPEQKAFAYPIEQLVNKARAFGLPERDIINALDMLEYAEYECALDIVVQQLYEHNIFIDVEYFQLVATVANRMNLPEQNYSFLKSLIK